MIRSYRSKRRKIQEELAFLNNRTTILNSVEPLTDLVLDTNNVLKSSSVPSSTLTKSNVLDSDENYTLDNQHYQEQTNKEKSNIFIENPIVNQCV